MPSSKSKSAQTSNVATTTETYTNSFNTTNYDTNSVTNSGNFNVSTFDPASMPGGSGVDGGSAIGLVIVLIAAAVLFFLFKR